MKFQWMWSLKCCQLKYQEPTLHPREISFFKRRFRINSFVSILPKEFIYKGNIEGVVISLLVLIYLHLNL